MKKILIFLVFFSIKNQLRAQVNLFVDGTTIYLVRHAEKEAGNDPVLTREGNQRAGDLMRILKTKKIRHIYVTNYRRSGLTADSMRLQLGIDTLHYEAADTTGSDLIAKIKANQDAGKAVLVIGHSNTVPQLIKALGVKNYEPHDIPDNEFDNLYLVKYEGNKTYLTRQKYGKRN